MNQYAVLFDMDGVICHTNPHHAKAFEAFFDKHEIPYTEQEFVDHMYGKHNSHIMTYFFKRPIHGAELLALENEKEQLFRDIYQDKIEEIPHFKTFLADLKANNFKTAVCTAAPQANMDMIVDQLGIRATMQTLMASEDVKLHKPHPEVYLNAAARLGVEPANCVVFEDSFSGVTAGLNAGMKVVAVLSSHSIQELPKCSYYIQDYSEISAAKILEIIKQ